MPRRVPPVPERAPRPQRGDELELTVESLAFGGEGVARLGDGGYVVFVAGAIPGDRVRAVVHKRKRSYAHARTLEVLEPSPERIAPIAEHPGVPWQVIPYERQLEIKRAQVDEALRRIGHLDGFELRADRSRARTVALPQQARVLVRRARRGDGELSAASTRPAGGNALMPIEDCLLASERGNLARRSRAGWCRAEGLSAWERGRSGARRRERRARGASATSGSARRPTAGRGCATWSCARAGARGKLQVRIVTTDGELEAGELAAALSEGLGESLVGRAVDAFDEPRRDDAGGETELVWGEAELPERLGELDLRISAEAFFQTNTEMAEVLYGIVAELRGAGGLGARL